MIEFIRNCKRFLSRTIDNVKSIIQWIPILWDNFDWDWTYLLLVLQYKLKRMNRYFVENGHLENSEKVASQMDECVKIIDRLISGFDYTEKEYEDLQEKWGKHTTSFNKVEDEFGNIHNEFDIYFTKARELGKEEEAEKEYWEMIELGEKKERDDLDKLFELIHANIKSWWD